MIKNDDYTTFTYSQRKIIENSTYPMYVKSAAGTGKTEILIQKILHILEHDKDASLENMVIISFTNKAVDELKERIYNSLIDRSIVCFNQKKLSLANKFRFESQLVNITNISTIHSFCERLLREYGFQICLSPLFEINSYLGKFNEISNDIVMPLFDSRKINDISAKGMIKLIFDAYKTNTSHGIYTVRLLSLPKVTELWNLKRKFVNIYNKVVTRVEDEKSSNFILSLNDLIIKSCILLKNPFVRQQVSNKYKYVFIDEYQDTNKPQFNLTKELIDMGLNVFLVGDERQAIYGFRGADVANSQLMSNYIDTINHEKFILNENFRSDPKLIEGINKIFNSDFLYKSEILKFDKTPLIPYKPYSLSEENPISLISENCILKIIKNIVETKTIRGKPVNYGDIVILCRKNYMVDEIGDICKSGGLPIEIIGGKGFYKSKEILDIYKFLNYIIYKRPEYKKELYLTDVYNAFTKSGYGNFDTFLQKLCNNAKMNSVENVLDYIIDNSNLEQYYIYNKNYQAISNLLKLRSISYDENSNQYMPAIEFLEFITRKIANDAEEDNAPILDNHKRKGTIRISTIHKAKGLSFPVVIIANMDEPLISRKKLPDIIMKSTKPETMLGFSKNVLGYEDPQYNELLRANLIELLEEEIRILYVACTRAKHYLYFHSRNKNIDNLNYPSWASWTFKHL